MIEAKAERPLFLPQNRQDERPPLQVVILFMDHRSLPCNMKRSLMLSIGQVSTFKKHIILCLDVAFWSVLELLDARGNRDRIYVRAQEAPIFLVCLNTTKHFLVPLRSDRRPRLAVFRIPGPGIDVVSPAARGQSTRSSSIRTGARIVAIMVPMGDKGIPR